MPTLPSIFLTFSPTVRKNAKEMKQELLWILYKQVFIKTSVINSHFYFGWLVLKVPTITKGLIDLDATVKKNHNSPFSSFRWWRSDKGRKEVLSLSLSLVRGIFRSNFGIYLISVCVKSVIMWEKCRWSELYVCVWKRESKPYLAHAISTTMLWH